MESKESVAIIIPAFEPDEKLLSLVEDLSEKDFKNILIVNDGSSEKYQRYFSESSSKYGCVVLRHRVNQGKGRAIKTAFNYILNERPDLTGAITVDSDGQHKIHDIERCCEALLQNKDKLVMGCRDFLTKTGKIPFRSRFGNIMTHKVLKTLCGVNLSDTQTGLRGFSSALMEAFLKTTGERFEYEMNMILDAHESGISIIQIPIETVYIGSNTSSHFNPLLDSLKIYSVFSKFVLSSVSSFLVDIIAFAILVPFVRNFTGTYIIAATYGARVLSSLFNYIMNKNKVFKNRAKGYKTIVKYFILCVIQVTLSAFLTSALFNLTHVNATLIKVLVDGVLFFVSFRIQREWVFKK